ncbi:MAG: sigma-70 family RNA polymerase sigma factor [Chloroflexi bacterium]|nr:sigma-70 family RNA polymerase sigma factor [Chloroflexota bacterium]
MNEPGRDERELVRRCREGSESAYAELVRRHRPRLYVLAHRLVGDRETAEDVVQETFLAAFRSIEKVDPRPSLDPWLNTIVLRIAGRAASRQRARPKSSIDELSLHESLHETGLGASMSSNGAGLAPGIAGSIAGLIAFGDPQEAAEAAELRGDLAAAVDRLPYKYRAAVVLRHVMDLDYAEAARELDIPLNTYKSHLLRGTRLLREDLADRLGPTDEALPLARSAKTGPAKVGAGLAGSADRR